MKIITDKNYYKQLDISKVEKKYKAKYIGDFSYIDNKVVPIFYVADPDVHKGHSHYFGLLLTIQSDGVVSAISIFDGESTIKGKNGEGFIGIKLESGEILVSTHRHMMVCQNGICVDGGSDYLRLDSEQPVNLVNLEIKNGEWKLK